MRHFVLRSDAYTIKEAARSSADFKFIYLIQLDHISHKYGLDSFEVKDELSKIDSLLKEYLGKNKLGYGIL